MVGCGKSIPTGVYPRIWDCTRPCGSDPKQLCDECNAEKLKTKFGLTDYEIKELKKVNGHLDGISEECANSIKYTHRGIRPE